MDARLRRIGNGNRQRLAVCWGRIGDGSGKGHNRRRRRVIAARRAGQLAPLGRADPDRRAGQHGRRARRRRHESLEAERAGAGAGRHGRLELGPRSKANSRDDENEELHLDRTENKLIGWQRTQRAHGLTLLAVLLIG